MHQGTLAGKTGIAREKNNLAGRLFATAPVLLIEGTVTMLYHHVIIVLWIIPA